MNKLPLVAIFLLPLIPAAFGFGYEQTKVIFFIIVTSVLGVCLLKSKLQFDLTSQVALGFLTVLLLASCLGVNLFQSFFGVAPYYQGWLLYAYLFIFFLSVKSADIKLKEWAWALSVSSALVGLVSLGQWLQINLLNQVLPTYAGRVVSTFGQPNFYSGFIVLSLPFTLYLFSQVKSRRLWVFVILGLQIAGVLVSVSRASIVLGLVVILWWLLANLNFKFKKLFTVLLVGTAVVVFGSVTFKFVQTEVEEIRDSQWLIYNSPEKRALIWPVIGELILDRPILGYGLENIYPAYSTYPGFFTIEPKPAEFYKLRELYIDRSHNYILDLLLFSGVFGLIVWLLFVVLLFAKSRQKSYGRSINVLIIGLVVYLIFVQFQNQSVIHLIYFWLIAGLVTKRGIDK